MELSNVPKVQCSNVVYLSVVDMHADTSEAMQKVVANLHTEYRIGESSNIWCWLEIRKSMFVYASICELKHEYGSELDWLIPFIGDWHLLSNYQS